jgi:hypothetical protein
MVHPGIPGEQLDARVQAVEIVMPNPQLTDEQRILIFAPLFQHVKEELERLSGGDSRLRWALQRKLCKDLGYLERGTPMQRRSLKMKKMIEQQGLCSICSLPLEKEAELDRSEAMLGYTMDNTRLVHHKCHRDEQAKKGYT